MANRRFSSGQRWRRKWLYHPMQAGLLYALLTIFRLLPVAWASAVGSWTARLVAPLLAGPTRRAERTLDICFPDMPKPERDRIIAGMWDNLGRIAGEYPHLGRLWHDRRRVKFVGWEHLDAARATGRPLFLVGGHIGNWELAARGAGQMTPPAAVIYRAPNNRLLDPVIRCLRHTPGLLQLRKGKEAAKGSIKLLNEGGTLALLVDQRLNAGIPVPFFGRPAMTAPAIAQLALRFDGIVLPVRVCRKKGARFLVIIEPPVELPRTDDRAADILAIMTEINAILERWIRDRPEQWLWLHRRWKG
ncbi:MAG TPA: lysophospholipid acyltransferase family protein [Alphaproteobacteria bacterium]|nr:lysophospholipid acyltransferase family protein [Alphaproteobacteria bacterium]